MDGNGVTIVKLFYNDRTVRLGTQDERESKESQKTFHGLSVCEGVVACNPYCYSLEILEYLIQ